MLGQARAEMNRSTLTQDAVLIDGRDPCSDLARVVDALRWF